MNRFIPTLTLGGVMLCLLGTATAPARTYRAYKGQDRPDHQLIRLLIPVDVLVLSVDGKKTGQDRLISPRPYTEMQLLPGNHHFVVRYEDIWDHDEGDDYDKLRSVPVELDLPAQDPGIYRLVHPGARTLKQARELAENFAPEIQIVQRYHSPVDKDPKSEGAVPQANGAESAMETEKTALITQDPPGLSALEVLKFGWNKASPAERKSFRKWIETN